MDFIMKNGISVKTETHKIKKSNTFLTYEGTVKRFSRIVGSEPISRETIVNHLEGLKRFKFPSGEIGYKPSVINFDFERLSGEYLKAENEIPFEIKKKEMKKVKNRYYTKNLNEDYSGKAITEEEIQTLITELPKRLSIIIETLANTGLRVSELIGIEKSNIDKIKSDLYVTYFTIIGKGNKQRSIFIENELLKRIENEFKGNHFLFETIEGKPFNRTYITRKLNEHSGKLIGKNIHSHTLRHSFITNEIKNGSPIDAISRQAGHSNVSFTLSKYSHNTFNPEMKKTRFRGKAL